jgi:hypothetical protein
MPFERDPPGSVLRIRRVKQDLEDGLNYEVTKVLEDREGKVLPGLTVAVHDSGLYSGKGGKERFFMGGGFPSLSPFLSFFLIYRVGVNGNGNEISKWLTDGIFVFTRCMFAVYHYL